MASKKKPAKQPAKKQATKKTTNKKQVAKKKQGPKKKAAPKAQAPKKKPTAATPQDALIEEVSQTIEEVKVVLSKKEDVLSELAKDALEQQLNSVVKDKKGFFKKLFGSKK